MTRTIHIIFLLFAPYLLAGLQPGLVSAEISAPVLKWQNGGCYPTWCHRAYYSPVTVIDLDGDETEILAKKSGRSGRFLPFNPCEDPGYPGLGYAPLVKAELEQAAGKPARFLVWSHQFRSSSWVAEAT